jgi:hypothetical protein
MTDQAQPSQPTAQMITLNFTRIKALKEAILEAITKWVDENNGSCGAEIGHAILCIMFDAGLAVEREYSLNIAVVSDSPQGPSLDTKARNFDA